MFRIFKKKKILFLGTLLSPASKNHPDLLCPRGHHQPISIDKVMCLTIHCQSQQALVHNCITGFHTIPSQPPFPVGIAGTFLA